jgi:hypothetical protein
MISSGTTGISTSGAGNVTLITAGGVQYNRIVIINEGSNAGFFSVDNGTTWGRIPAATASAPGFVEWWGISTRDVLMKRASADMSAVFAFADWVEDT